MHVQLYILAVLSFVAGALAGNLPSFIQPCSIGDPDLNQCIQKAIVIAGPKFAEGIPELGIAPLDPVQLGTVVVDNPALKLTFTDTVVTGLRDFIVNSYKINTEKGKAVLDFTANVTLKGNYVMDGQVLILPIRGNGQAKIKITNLNIVIKYEYETKDGHWVVTGHKDSYKMDRAQFKFTNLFGGNKELADTTIKFINENWSLIIQEIAPSAIEMIIKSCVEEVKKFFRGGADFGADAPVNANAIGNVLNANWEPVIYDIAPVAFEHIISACVREAEKLFAAVPAARLLLP